MAIFFVGLGLFLLGAVLNAVGWRKHRNTVKSLDPFLEWLLETIKQWFGLLTGEHSTTGQRVAAFGAILSAVGLVVMVAGLLVWAV